MREVSMTNYNLQRFLDAQRGDYEQALAEVRNGRKYSHWIWYIFPQLKGLGMSYNSQYYGLSGKICFSLFFAAKTIIHSIMVLAAKKRLKHILPIQFWEKDFVK